MSTQRFKTSVIQSENRTYVVIPFDPNEVWGEKERHYVAGSIGGHPFRGCLDFYGNRVALPLGPAWVRDNELADGESVEVVMSPEGHQIDNVSPDVAASLTADPEARAFFESVAPFYRNNYIRWIEDAKRPETRSKRIAETVELLRAGKKQR